VTLIEPGRQLGGMMSGGLGYANLGDSRMLDGLGRKFMLATFSPARRALRLCCHGLLAPRHRQAAGLSERFARRVRVGADGGAVREMIDKAARAAAAQALATARAAQQIDVRRWQASLIAAGAVLVR
jgi:hypothetical protein